MFRFYNHVIVVVTLAAIAFRSANHISFAADPSELVIKTWSTDINSDINSDRVKGQLTNLLGRNVSDIVATDEAFAVRIAASDEEATETVKRMKKATNFNAHDKGVAERSRPPSIYVIFGSSEYGKSPARVINCRL